jgi:hypothetical protein
MVRMKNDQVWSKTGQAVRNARHRLGLATLKAIRSELQGLRSQVRQLTAQRQPPAAKRPEPR